MGAVAEVIAAGGVIITGVFALIRYMVTQNTKREAALLEHQSEQQEQMMTFYEKKNGHLERIANKFSDSNNAMTSAVGKLTTEIRVLSERRK